MTNPILPVNNTVGVVIPDSCRDTFLRVCSLKGITPEHAASLMIYSACRALEEVPFQKDTELLADLDFSRSVRAQTINRVDNLLGIAEKTLLDAKGIQQALRNRSFGDPATSKG